MSECGYGSHRVGRIVKRARETSGWPAEWDSEQIVECPDCGQRRLA